MRRFAPVQLVLIFSLVLAAWLCAACSDSGDTGPVDGDADAVDGDADGDVELVDGDLDADPDFERERPELEPFVWEDETYGYWTDTPFCFNGTLFFKDDFEDQDLSKSPAWMLDPLVEGNESGDPANVVWPAIVFDDQWQRYVLSADPDATGSHLKVGRLYIELNELANAFHMMTRISGDSGRNLLWLNHDTDPTDYFGPQIQLFHNAQPSEGSDSKPQQLQVDDETGLTWCDLGDLGDGWHRIELYRAVDQWRVDLDRVTVCKFKHPIDSARPLRYMFIGLSGEVDDIAVGNCPIPVEGIACSDHGDCSANGVCGRDGVCHDIRATTCQSGLQCKDGSDCIGERADEDLIGDGTCTQLCSRHATCRPSELCVPHSEDLGTCQALCRDDDACPDGQSCWEVGGVKGCLPDDCKNNGQWEPSDSGLLTCVCREGFVFDPFSNRCEDRGQCKTSSDCGYSEFCGSDRLCYRNRDVACFNDEACPEGLGCYGFIYGDAITGTGQCMTDCARDTDCLAYESCIPTTPTAWTCLPRCNSDEDCEADQACHTAFNGQQVCMAHKCQTNGEWQWSDVVQTFTCECINNTSKDPNTGRCL